MFTRKLKDKKGFTLIELLIIIVIIAILVVVIIGALDAARKRGRDARRKSDLRSLQTGLALYDDTWEHYPITCSYTALENYKDAMQIRNWPQDPINTGWHVYHYTDGHCGGTPAPRGLDYVLRANMEVKSNETNGICNPVYEPPDGSAQYKCFFCYCVGTKPDL